MRPGRAGSPKVYAQPSARAGAQHAAPLQRASARRLGLLRLGWRRSGGFRCRHERNECRGVLHGDIREDLAVESDAGSLEAVNQLAIGQAVQAGGGADALNPQAAVLALLDAAVALGVTVGAIRGFLCGLVELAFGEEKAFCPLEVLLAPCPALGAAFYACHGFLLRFFLSRCMRSEEFLSDGSKDPPLQRTSPFSRPRPNALGRQTGRVNAQKKARTATGLSPGMNCLPQFTIALRRRFTSAAYRPAGTREALPGTICGTCVPHFLWRAHPKAAL